MNPNARAEQKCVLIIGIGSPHGDDRMGWDVIERLEGMFSCSQNGFESQVKFRKAATPHDILDWLDSNQVVHIVDTVYGQFEPIERYRIENVKNGPLQCRPDRELHLSAAPCSDSLLDTTASSNAALLNVFETLNSKSSHQLDLISTLELASVLGQSPRQMFLWTIAVDANAGQLERSSTAESLVQTCAAQISIHISSSLSVRGL